jgi:hypothetical protein
MEPLNNTCTFRESAQKALNDAFCAFAENENMLQLADKTGIGKTILRNKLNPSQSHRLAVDELILITKESGNYTIINSVLRQLDLVAANVNSHGEDATLVKYALENSKLAGELAAQTLENGGEIRLPRRKAQKLLAVCNAGIANLVLLANDLENRTSGVSPFLSMATDYIVTNGAPGLIG